MPSAEAQLEFLTKLQRIADEGDFTATYKFALLIALTEIAIEVGSDNDDPLKVSTRAIGEKFVELYWSQTAPYSATPEPPRMLSQIRADNAAIPNLVARFRAETGVISVTAARKHPGWAALVSTVTATVRDQPVRYLQNVGGRAVTFLYELSGRGCITLLPGATFCLRRFHGIVLRLAQTGWVRHVRENPRNWPLIGSAGDLEAFMFEQSRRLLAEVAAVLQVHQSNTCFYCEGNLGREGDVDHFIPWSRYPRDLAHNFVLAHPGCNRAKSAMLAGYPHLERWALRNEAEGEEIGRMLVPLGLQADLATMRAVARWSYASAIGVGAHVWLSRGTTAEANARLLEMLI